MKNVDAGKEIADEILRPVNSNPSFTFSRNRHVVGRAKRPGNASSGPYLPMWGFLFYDWNQSNASDFTTGTAVANGTGIQCARMAMGYNWATVWEPWIKARLAARGIPWSPGTAVGTPDITEVRYWTANSGGSRTAAGTHVELAGLITLEIAACFDVIVLGHSPPLEHIAKIKQLSVCGTKVLTGLHNFASINQRTDDYARLEAIRSVSRGYPLAGKVGSGCGGTNVNRYGCTAIDWYESSGGGFNPGVGWPRCDGTPSWSSTIIGCPHTPAHASLNPNATAATSHTWECDVTDTDYQSTLPEAFSDYVTNYYTSGGTALLDGMLVDNMLMFTYGGDATLSYPDAYTSAAFRAGWVSMMANWQTHITGSSAYSTKDFFRWTNSSDLMTHYTATHCKNRWAENFFVDPTTGSAQRAKSEILAAISTAKANGLRLVLGMTGTNAFAYYWATTAGALTPATYGTWADIIAKVAQENAWSNVYAQALRQTNGGYCFWQEGFRPLP